MKKIITFIGKNIKKIECSTSRHNFGQQITAARFFSHDVRTCIQIQEDDITENYWKHKAQMNFNKMLPDIIHSLANINDKNSELIPAYKWLVKELQKNLTDSDKNCGLIVLQSYQILMNNSSLEPENERLVQIMGWCAEMLRKSVLASSSSSVGKTDDDEPNSSKVGSHGIDINKVLHSSLNQLLWQYFYNVPCFSHILHLFHKVNHFAIMGQVLDKETHADKTLSQFTMNRYSAITKYKSSYNTFALPLLLSFYMANITDEEIHRQAKTIALEMGHFYQVQKDYHDCYGNEASHGNISNGRCDWLSVVALQRVNPFQKQVLMENYGKDDFDSINKVKELYEKIGIPKTYKIYEDHTYDLLCTQIQQSSRGLPHILFFKMMERFYVKN